MFFMKIILLENIFLVNYDIRIQNNSCVLLDTNEIIYMDNAWWKAFTLIKLIRVLVFMSVIGLILNFFVISIIRKFSISIVKEYGLMEMIVDLIQRMYWII